MTIYREKHLYILSMELYRAVPENCCSSFSANLYILLILCDLRVLCGELKSIIRVNSTCEIINMVYGVCLHPAGKIFPHLWRERIYRTLEMRTCNLCKLSLYAVGIDQAI